MSSGVVEWWLLLACYRSNLIGSTRLYSAFWFLVQRHFKRVNPAGWLLSD